MNLTDEELTRLIAQTNDTAMQARLKELLQMPPDERAAAMAQLTAAYDPRRSDLRTEIEQNFDMLTAQGPAALEGPSGNPYAVTVAANPLEHAAAGWGKYKAGQGIKEGRAKLDALSGEEEKATAGMMNAQLAQLLREAEEEKRKRAHFGVA